MAALQLMAQAALALAAEVTGHSAKAVLSRRFQCLFEARLTLVEDGFTEGLSDDGEPAG